MLDFNEPANIVIDEFDTSSYFNPISWNFLDQIWQEFKKYQKCLTNTMN